MDKKIIIIGAGPAGLGAAYPVPTLERDEALQRIQSYLSSNDIYSCGRFGGWRYEVGSIDDSIEQGKEAIDTLLLK